MVVWGGVLVLGGIIFVMTGVHDKGRNVGCMIWDWRVAGLNEDRCCSSWFVMRFLSVSNRAPQWAHSTSRFIGTLISTSFYIFLETKSYFP